jgi:TonB family protein
MRLTTDGAAIVLGDGRHAICETSSAVESPRADRRASRRSLTAVPMWARWRSDREHEMKVNSRDIGDGGIFFHVNSEITIGTEVEVTFTLPSDPGAAGNKRLHVKGTVIRSERQADRTGCALRITSSELLEADDIVTQARLAVRRAANNDSSGGQFRAARVHLLPLAYRLAALMILASLAGVGAFIALYAGGPASAAAALREIVRGVRSIGEKARPADVLQSGVERNAKGLPAGGVRATQRKASSSPAKHPARNPDVAAVQVHSAVDQPVQAEAFSFNNNNVLRLELNKGKPVLRQAYVGELPSPPTKPMSAGSLGATAVPNEAATDIPNSTVVVLRVVVRRNGTVKDVQRASGSVELAPSAIAAVRHWKFQPDPGNSGAMRRLIYVTVHFTISAQ